MKRKNDLAVNAIQLHNSEYTNNAGISFSKKTLGSSARILVSIFLSCVTSLSVVLGPAIRSIWW